jgi:hypothetical protein
VDVAEMAAPDRAMDGAVVFAEIKMEDGQGEEEGQPEGRDPFHDPRLSHSRRRASNAAGGLIPRPDFCYNPRQGIR